MNKKIIGLLSLIIGVLLLTGCTNEKTLNNNLNELGKQFYEEFYYPSQEKSQSDVKAFVARFKDTGVKINLENIAKISKVDKSLVDSMVNSKTKEKCDAKNTTVTIYPKKPYGKTDYKIETNLECGFKKSK